LSRDEAGVRGTPGLLAAGKRFAQRVPGAPAFEVLEGSVNWAAAMIPEVFECPRCERQFVIDGIPDTGSEEVHCPQCSRFLGVRDIAFVLRTELDELIERLSYEKDRLEKDEAVYGLTDCDPEMKYYGREVSRVIRVLRSALKELDHLKDDYRLKS
jgi:DNA-directed RNA polymerase subunit RPC12/RpoP